MSVAILDWVIKKVMTRITWLGPHSPERIHTQLAKQMQHVDLHPILAGQAFVM